MFKVNDVVQFNENHKWCGCLGIIEEISGERYLIGVPVPQKGTAYIFVMDDEKAIEYIGEAILLPRVKYIDKKQELEYNCA